MGWARSALIASGLLASAAHAPAVPDSPLSGRTTSSSGHFVIYSKDAVRRSLIAQRADAARTAWNAKLGPDESGARPIIIQDLIGSVKPRGNPNAVTTIFVGDGGALKVQTCLYDSSVLRGQALSGEIYRALGLEWIYRNHPLKAGKPFRSPPIWLLEALAEEDRLRQDGTPAGVYAALLQSERPPKLEDFLRAKPELMEATSLTLYRTEALAFLKALLGLPEGGRGLGSFLSSLAQEDSDMKSLLAAFPSLGNDPSRLGKLWTLAIARGSAGKGAEPLSVGETSRALKSLLDIFAPPDPKKPKTVAATGAAALSAIAQSDGGPFLMRQKSADLFALEYRAHPLLKPVIAEYRSIAAQLAQKPRKNVSRQVEENGKIFDLLLQRAGQVDDYMNWFEATQLDTLSDNFLKISSPAAPEKRRDALSLHLDEIEDRGW
ncbi:MAG: hypothetical protein WCS65_05935 [Verrucomicrobiae bacterium]